MPSSLDEESGNSSLDADDVGCSEYEGFSEGSDSDAESGSNSETGGPSWSEDKSEQPPSTEWVEFNKKVISMRPLFKSAKVQFVNKLARQIKMLRNRKGDEGQVEKCRRKAERLVEEIAYVNRLKQDIVAKFALLHSMQEVVKIVNDPGSSMEYRVKAKVAAMPKISKAADDYHQMHPDWRESLIKLIQLAGSKMKKKRRKMRGKGKKSKKKKPIATDEKKQPPRKVQAEDDGTGRFDESNFPQPPPGTDVVANADSSSDETEWSGPKVRFGSSSEEELSSEEDLNLRNAFDDEARRNHADYANENKQIKTPLQKKKLDNKTFTEPIKRKASDVEPCHEKTTKIMVNNTKKANSEVKNHRAKKIKNEMDSDIESDIEELRDSSEPQGGNVDPFFMTSDNKEYKTLWKIEPADSFKNKDKDEEKEPLFAFKNARTYQEVISGKPAPRPNKNKKDKVKPGQGKLDPTKLHPSWQAKKKLNLSTVPFQGKKIVFGDD